MMDHIVPKTRDGTHDLQNLRWVCRDANRAKRSLTDDEFLSLCKDVAEWFGRSIVIEHHCARD